MKEYSKINKEKISEIKRSYYESNRENLIKKSYNYYHSNKDRIMKEWTDKYRQNPDFYRNKSNQAYHKHKNKYRIRRKEYRIVNFDKLSRKRKEYYSKNKDEILLRQKIYIDNNKQMINARKKIYRNKNKESIALSKKISMSKNPLKYKALLIKRREIKKGIKDPYPSKNIIQSTYDLFNHKCFNCNSIEFLSLDHHIPLSKGGKLEKGNTVLLCRSCNSSKRNKLPEDFYSHEQLIELREKYGIGKKETNRPIQLYLFQTGRLETTTGKRL
ncbi:MAG: HNH endonuclease [Leptospiraceae bacterium]|nr:HNH endonuclease [Leptospiraceae bacterium]